MNALRFKLFDNAAGLNGVQQNLGQQRVIRAGAELADPIPQRAVSAILFKAHLALDVVNGLLAARIAAVEFHPKTVACATLSSPRARSAIAAPAVVAAQGMKDDS